MAFRNAPAATLATGPPVAFRLAPRAKCDAWLKPSTLRFDNSWVGLHISNVSIGAYIKSKKSFPRRSSLPNTTPGESASKAGQDLMRERRTNVLILGSGAREHALVRAW